MEDSGYLERGSYLEGRYTFEPDYSHEPSNIAHVITGGVGGMGILMASILVKSGAKCMVLTSRRDAVPSESMEMFQALTDSRAQIVRRRVNSSSAEGMREVMTDNTLHPPILGICHGAGVLRDGTINNQTRQKYTDVFQPKYNGAWILHNLTANKPWDIRNFVMLSSMAAVGGNVGQSNHSAANAGMDFLAAFRSNNGLVASSVNLGAIAEIGYAARHTVGVAKTTKEQTRIALEAAAEKVSPPANMRPPNQESEDTAAITADK